MGPQGDRKNNARAIASHISQIIVGFGDVVVAVAVAVAVAVVAVVAVIVVFWGATARAVPGS